MEAASMWVPIDRSGSVVRMRQSFFDVYGEALQGRKVPGRVDTPDLGEIKLRAPWPLRKSDLDVVGHVNNAALWEAVSQYAPDKPNFVSVIHHASVEADDDVEVVVGESALWLCVDGELRVSASFA
jgi:acyl-ACP thioesterase